MQAPRLRNYSWEGITTDMRGRRRLYGDGPSRWNCWAADARKGRRGAQNSGRPSMKTQTYHGQVEDLSRENEQLAVALERLRADVTRVCPENWREDPDWVRLIEAHGLKAPIKAPPTAPT